MTAAPTSPCDSNAAPAVLPDTAPTDIDAAVQRLVTFYETLAPAQLAQLEHLYAAQAQFKDPFNAVVGRAAITAIFEHMFVALDAPRFVVTQRVRQGTQCFLTWEFHFAFRSFQPATRRTIVGASHLVFNAQGLVQLHRDYWDAAEEVYEKLPLLGGLMRWLKARARG